MAVYGLGEQDNYPPMTLWGKPPWEIGPDDDGEEDEEWFDDRIEPWEIEEMLDERDADGALC